MTTIPMAYFEDKYLIHTNGSITKLSDNLAIKPSKNPNGYLKYTFCLNGIKKQLLIHRVVALHFLPNPYIYPQINHKDGNKENNSICNLEWVSQIKNIQHALKIGLRKGYMSFNDKEKYLYQVLNGTQVKDLATMINRRPEVLHKMLRETAIKLNIKNLWDIQMKENRKNVAIQNITKYNNLYK